MRRWPMVTSRTWFTAKQKAELWERWKDGQSVLAISRAQTGPTGACGSGRCALSLVAWRSMGIYDGAWRRSSLQWSPEQISGWLKQHFPTDPDTRISHAA